MNEFYWAILVVGIVSNLTGYVIGHMHKEYKVSKEREINFEEEELNLPEVEEEKNPQYH